MPGLRKTARRVESRKMRLTVSITFVALLLITVPVSGQVEDHYIGKTVQVLQPLPDEIPLMIFDRPGVRLDTALMKLKFQRSGIGLEAGVYAVITNVEISGNEIRFELVGTGATPPPAGIPASAFDEAVWQWGSGRIAIEMQKPISSYTTPITSINDLLSTVVTTRELVSAEGLPQHFQQAIAKGEIIRGMNQRAVYLVMGAPDDVITELEGDIISEAWMYRKQDLTTVSVLFRDGIVFLIKNY
jgi:hypothetical protein